jgi:hypothetical protein
MSAIQQTMPPLIAGVAQGTDSQISPSNLRACDNFIPDLVWGLGKRPGSEFISPVQGSATGAYFNVKLGDEDDYLIHVNRNGTVNVTDAYSGEAYSVTQQATSYLTHTGVGDIEVLKLGDFVFILNRTKTIAKAANLSPNQKVHGWAEVKSISFGSEYIVRIRAQGETPVTLSYITPSSGKIEIDAVVDGIVADDPGGTPYTIARIGHSVGVRWTDPSVTKEIKIEASGGFSDDAIKGYSGQVSSIQELPSDFAGGRPVLVKPTNATGPGYWVTFSEADADQGTAGVWTETLQRNEQFRIDASTMPHALVRLGNGSWIVRPLDGSSPVSPTVNTAGVVTAVSPTGTYNGRYWLGQTFHVTHATGKGLRLQVTGIDSDSHPTSVAPIRPGFGFAATNIVTANNGDQFEVTGVATVTYNNPAYANEKWTDRTVGSLASVPWPSFVGRSVTGLGFYLNRLVLLSEDNVIASKAGDYLNFFPTTAIQVLADDPVDINTGETTRTVLRHTVDYNGRLICVSGDKQFTLRGGDEGFTPQSAALTVSSRVKSSTILRPLSTQISWLVVEENNAGVSLVEMYPNADDDPNVSRPTSLNLQAPTYVPRGVFTAAIEEDLGFACLVSQQDPTSLYMWRWQDQSRQRLMASWFRIVLPAKIEHVYFLDNHLYCVGRFNSTRLLLRIPMGINDPSGRIEFDGYFFNPRLDLMDFTLNVTYNEATDQTTIPVTGTIYDTPDHLPRVFVLSGPNKFVFYEPEYSAGNLILPGNVGSTDAVIGYSFSAEALLPHIYLRGQDGQGIPSNPPKVRRITIRSFRSGGFGASITVPGREPYIAECSQIIARQYTLGELTMRRIGEITVPTMCDGDAMDLRILSSCPLPVHIQEIIWKGTYTTKGLRSQ